MPEGSSRRKRARGKVTGFEEVERGMPVRADAVEAEYTGRRIPAAYAPVPAITSRTPVAPLRAANLQTNGPQIPESSPTGGSLAHDTGSGGGQAGLSGGQAGTAGTSHRKATNVVMDEFLGRKDEILDLLFSLEVDPRVDSLCSCGSGGSCIYRCADCFNLPPSCATCIRDAHVRNPLHRIQRWTGSYFARDSLHLLGLVLCLGHSGSLCPNAVTVRDGEPSHNVESEALKVSKSLVVVHTNGVHQINYACCECAPRASVPAQLLQAGLYPATWTTPGTAFTIKVLEHYHLNSVQSRISAHDYWALLRRLTDNTREGSVPPRYEELLRASREWRALKRLKRSGQAHGISDLLPGQSRSVAVLCPACPQPEVNLPENWKDAVTEDNLHTYTVYIGIDGNFQAVRKQKRQDPDDKALLDGRGYFVDTEEYQQWMNGKDEDSPEEHKSTCANLKSMKLLSARTGISVAGIIAIFCRHGMYWPNTIIDLEVGEKFRILDYSLFNALSRDPAGDLNWILTCDKGCQYSVNLKRRFQDTLPPTPAIERVKVLVPKFHLQGHREECRFKYSLNYTKYCGRTDGEYVERPWRHSNHTAMITRDMNPGHRQDTYEDCNGDWNYGIFISIASFLLRKLKEAYTGHAEATATYESLTAATSAEQRTAWAKLPRDPYVKDGWMHSIYRADRRKLPTYSELLEALRQPGEQRDGLLEQLQCPNTFLTLGLEIEEQQITLRSYISGLSDDPTGQSRERTITTQISLRRGQLRDQLSRFRAMQHVHMPALGPTFVTEDYSRDIDEDYGCPEHDTLDLPSTWADAAEREKKGFTKLADLERKLRSGKAAAALAGVRVALQLYASFMGDKRKNVAGQKLGTRANTVRLSHRKDIDQHASLYRRQYEALLRLGLSAEESTHFRPLTDDDLNNTTGSAKHSEQLGDSRRKPAWFWGGDRDSDDADTKELDSLTQEELRVRWFRAEANRERFAEEVEICHAELERTVRTHQHMKTVWETLAHRHATSQDASDKWRARFALGRQAYALKQAAICSQRESDATRCVDAAQTVRAGEVATSRAPRGQADRIRSEWSYYQAQRRPL